VEKERKLNGWKRKSPPHSERRATRETEGEAFSREKKSLFLGNLFGGKKKELWKEGWGGRSIPPFMGASERIGKRNLLSTFLDEKKEIRASSLRRGRDDSFPNGEKGG